MTDEIRSTGSNDHPATIFPIDDAAPAEKAAPESPAMELTLPPSFIVSRVRRAEIEQNIARRTAKPDGQ